MIRLVEVKGINIVWFEFNCDIPKPSHQNGAVAGECSIVHCFLVANCSSYFFYFLFLACVFILFLRSYCASLNHGLLLIPWNGENTCSMPYNENLSSQVFDYKCAKCCKLDHDSSSCMGKKKIFGEVLATNYDGFYQ